ncbi:MAG: sulfite exporter TauE/SafE family protein [Acidobacteriota bacterium]|nr:sulfite exporter TauE/SafE family protein [Acidobacteriota bacterium]
MASLTLTALAILILLFFVTSAIGVVTGSNSLITVPVMFQFGIDSRVAVATNMFGLTFLSIGGVLPFVGKNVFDRKRLPVLIVLTLLGSTLGALLVGIISSKTMPLIVSISMIVVTIFTLFNRNSGIEKNMNPTTGAKILTYLLTFALGIYGGLYSGGYVTILTVVYISFAGMTFTEAVANTKLINVFSSLIATFVFAYQGLIDYKLGIILAITMFIAAYIGARVVTKLNDLWLRRIFLATVLILALKILFVDIFRL